MQSQQAPHTAWGTFWKHAMMRARHPLLPNWSTAPRIRRTRGFLCTHLLTDDFDTPVSKAVFLTDLSLMYAFTQIAFASSE